MRSIGSAITEEHDEFLSSEAAAFAAVKGLRSVDGRLPAIAAEFGILRTAGNLNA